MLNILEKRVILPAIQHITKENFLEYVNTSNELQYWDHNNILNYQWQKTKNIIKHAYDTSPYYKEKYDKHGINLNSIQNPDDFKKIPFLEKDEIRKNSINLLSNNHAKKMQFTHSAGTMGVPISIYRDANSYTIDRAVKLRCLKWFGVDVGDKEARIWGFSPDRFTRLKQKSQDFLLNRIRMSPFDLNIGEIEKFYKKMKSFRPKVLYGWLSGVYKFAQIASENHLDISDTELNVVVTTAEPLNEFQRKIIEHTFQRKLANEYGCSEMGVIAFECPHGKLHLMIDNVYTEFVNNPVTGVSEIIVTDLKNFSMPLIRYRIGDVGKLSNPASGCKCGVNFPTMDIVEGRGLDTIRTRSGNYIHGGLFAYIGFDLIEKYGSIQDFRIRQKTDYDIIISYSKQERFDNRILKEFSSSIKKYLGHDINIKFEMLDSIPLETSGKQRFVISDFPKE